MTALAGASVFLIAASAIALLFGWITANSSLIWTSIVASIGAGVTLGLAYFRAREEGPAESPPAESPPAESPPAESPPAESPPAEDRVVGMPGSKRFHRPSCRYAASKSAENLTKEDALQRGFIPCGVCKP